MLLIISGVKTIRSKIFKRESSKQDYDLDLSPMKNRNRTSFQNMQDMKIHQELYETDFHYRVDFCVWVLAD